VQGFRKKPVGVGIIAASYFFLPALNALWPAAQNGAEAHLTSSFFHDWICAWVAAISIFVISRPAFFFLAVLSVYVITLKIIRLIFGPADYFHDMLLLVLWFSLAAGVLLTPLRFIYLNPQMRRWRRWKRYDDLTSGAIRFNAYQFPVVVLNISEGGAFVRLGGAMAGDFPGKAGQVVRFSVMMPHGKDTSDPLRHTFECDAKLVWNAREKDAPRLGMGLEFIGLDPMDRKWLKKSLRLLKKTES